MIIQDSLLFCKLFLNSIYGRTYQAGCDYVFKNSKKLFFITPFIFSFGRFYTNTKHRIHGSHL